MSEEKTLRLIEVIRNKKQLEAEEKSLRPDVIQYLKDGNVVTGIKWSIREPVKYYDNKFLEWLFSKLSPIAYRKCIKETVNIEEVEKLIQSGHLQYDEIPEDCYTIQTQDVLTVK